MTQREHARLHRYWEGSVEARLAKTRCINGHPLDGVFVHRGRRHRYCKTCKAASERRRKAKLRAAASALMFAASVDELPAEPFESEIVALAPVEDDAA